MQASYDELNEYEKPDKNYNLPKGIRVTGETKQLKDDVVHQAIKDAETNQPDDTDSSNLMSPSYNQPRGINFDFLLGYITDWLLHNMI